MTTSMKDNPKVKGTKIKWYMEVRANCHRDKSTNSAEIMLSPSINVQGNIEKTSEYGLH